jgi:hypothetical protein
MKSLAPHLLCAFAVVVLASAAIELSGQEKKARTLDVNPQHISTDASVKYDYDIVYVRAPRHGDNKQIAWTEVFNPIRAEPGSDLVLLHPDGTEEVLVEAGADAITDPFVSFDGQSVYYARIFNIKKPGNDRPVSHHSDVFRIHVKTRKIVQLTHQTFTPNTGIATGKFATPGIYNLGPCPLPGGRVIFTSNRNGYAPTKGYTPTTLQLFTMDDDGNNVELIGHLNVNSALHPTILKDGRVMFTSYESQGLRDLRNWALWSIHPDGTNWGPLFSGFVDSSALHFMTQLSDGHVVVEEYYNLNNLGFGTYYKFPLPTTPGEPAFGSAYRGDARNLAYRGSSYSRIPFSPLGLDWLTPFSDANDVPARLSNPGDPKSPRVGKVTHPSAAPGNHLLTVWSPGPVNSNNGLRPPAIDGGIYLIKSGKVVDEPGKMLLIKNDPKFNEQWPRALVPYKAIYDTAEPTDLKARLNDGKLSKHLPEGTPFGLVGTSSLYKHESYPDGVVPSGGVRSRYRVGKDPFEGLGSLRYDPSEMHWFVQGADAGRYDNRDIHAIRILVTEPTTDPRYTNQPTRRWWNIANERLRILGEIPVRKFGEGGANGTQPLDPDGNPDTSFLAKIPADVPWTFQTLDKNGMVLNMAQTWHQVRPGEVRNDCGGCHAHSQKPTDFKLTRAATPDYVPFDLTNQTPLLTTRKNDESGKKWDDGNETGLRFVKQVKNVEYFRDVKPILDRSCVACHTQKWAKPAGNLVLDDDGLMPTGNAGTLGAKTAGPPQKVPGTFYRLALDAHAKFGHKSPVPGGNWSGPQASRYVRYFQSRRSLLIWKVYGTRLDGWENDDFAFEATPGDPNSLVYKGKPVANGPEVHRLINIAYLGSSMPPPEAVAGTYVGPDGKMIKVPALTDEDRLTLVRWIDLGCPIDFVFDPANPAVRGQGWLADDNRPTLTLTYPRPGTNREVNRIVIGAHDYDSGLDRDSLQVVADFAVEGRASGENLASRFKEKENGIWALTLSKPLPAITKGKLSVSIRDKAGNVTRIDRSFSIDPQAAHDPREGK